MKILKQFIFFGLLALIILIFGRVLIAKDENYDKYKIYNQLEDNSLDVCYLGTSNSDAAINPDIIDGKANCESFNYSVTGIRIDYLYYRIVDLLKTQKPSLLVIDTTTFIPIETDTIDLLVRWTFNPLPISANKVNGLSNLIGFKNGLSYISSYPLYHKRIFKLTTEDWEKAFNLYEYPEKGKDETPSKNGWRNLGDKSMDRIDDYFLNDFSDVTQEQKIEESQEDYLNKILELAKENNIKILFLSVPYKETQNFSAETNIKVNNYLRNNYESDYVKILDMNTIYNQMGFDYKYMIDEGHVNEKGSNLVSTYLAEYILNNYNIH